jgi:chromosome segregation ATPase
VEASDAALAEATAITLLELEALKQHVRELEVQLSTAVGEEEVQLLKAQMAEATTEVKAKAAARVQAAEAKAEAAASKAATHEASLSAMVAELARELAEAEAVVEAARGQTTDERVWVLEEQLREASRRLSDANAELQEVRSPTVSPTVSE